MDNSQLTATIRPYCDEDRPAVYQIAADTAFFGEPVETYLDDRSLFCDAFYALYLEAEQERCWVACAGQEVVGFLTGCFDTAAHEQAWLRKTLPAVLRGVLQGRYRIGKLTWQYARLLARAAAGGELAKADLAAYPAHLHINLAAGWRGRGLGSRLMRAYLGQLSAHAIPGVHLMTTNLNQAACRLYERTGFRLLDARATRLWNRHVAGPVENRCYGLRLG